MGINVKYSLHDDNSPINVFIDKNRNIYLKMRGLAIFTRDGESHKVMNDFVTFRHLLACCLEDEYGWQAPKNK